MDVSTDCGTQESLLLNRLYDAAKRNKVRDIDISEQRKMATVLSQALQVPTKTAEDYIATAEMNSQCTTSLMALCQKAARVRGVSLEPTPTRPRQRDVNPPATELVAPVAPTSETRIDGDSQGGTGMKRKRKARAGASASGCDRCEGTGVVFDEGRQGTIVGQPCSCMDVDETRSPEITPEAQQYYAKKRYAQIRKEPFALDPALEAELADYEAARERMCRIEKQREGLSESLRRIDGARLPNKFLNAVMDNSIAAEVREWTDRVISGDRSVPRVLVLQGDVGRGKTHAGVAVGKEFIRRTDKSVYYCSSRELFDRARDSDRAPYPMARHLMDCDQELKWIRETLKEVDVLVFDEVGQQNPKSPEDKLIERYEDIIDARYSSGKATIFITNHTRDKKTSLNGRTIEKQIGERAASRLKEAVTVDFFGEDRRTGTTLVSVKKDYPDFQAPYAGKDLTTCLDRIARLPIFQTVSNDERRQLTQITSSGEILEKDRPSLDVFEDVWEHDSTLVLSGPKCGTEDGFVFLGLIQLYSKWCHEGGSGLRFETTLSDICVQIGNEKTGPNRLAVKRSLHRLRRIGVDLRDGAGKCWDGGMIDEVAFEGTRRWSKVIIRFNPSMVPFYDAGAYSRIDLAPLMALNSYGQKMQLFLLSHRDNVKEIPIQKWQRIMGQSHLSMKVFRDKIRESIKQQIEKGVLAPESGIRPDGVVVTHLQRSERLTA